MTYHAKVIAGGKIVIPAELRRALNVHDGDMLMIERRDDTLVLSTRRTALSRLQEEVRKYVPEGVSLADELIAERRQEAEREEEESRRYWSDRDA